MFKTVVFRCVRTVIRHNKNSYEILNTSALSRNYSLKIFTASDPAVQKYLAYLENEYKTLQDTDRAIIESKHLKRLSELQPIIRILNEKHIIFDSLASLNELSPDRPDGSKDQELLSLVEKEQQSYKHKLEELDIELMDALLPEEHYEYCSDIVLEVTAGVGGQEAMLFARELFDMYSGYAEFKNWSAEIAQLEHTELGGLRHASLFISGNGVFQHLKHEAGVHRVQRVPTTEKSGRIHTSTVSVAALPQPADVDIELKDKDLRIETKRASGAGGQHVNTTDSAVRIIHIPTGIAVESQVDRSQIKNREIALQRLRAKIFQLQTDQQMADINATRKLQVGSSFRSEKIRTYNFNQDRITDHRLGGNIHNLRGFLCGNQLLDTLLQDLQQTSKQDKLKQMIAQFQAPTLKN